jgi:hypothetical protein
MKTNSLIHVRRGYDVVITHINDRLKIALVKNRDIKKQWARKGGSRQVQHK